MEKEIYLERLQDAMAKKYSDEYIAACMDYAKKLLTSGLPVIFDGAHLHKILKMHTIKPDCYQEFQIVGKKGKSRTICAPSKRLKARQRWILDYILYNIPVAQCCEGFRKKHSIYTNAKQHIGYQQNLNMDIKDFFPSITQDRVVQVYKEIGYSTDAADALGRTCCHEGRLPQGAPTSPYLANIVCKTMDMQLMDYARRHHMVYTRYADDMAFSGDCDMSKHCVEIERIIEQHGFEVNAQKTRIYTGKKRRMITGIVVKDDGLSIPRSYKRKLKQEIYYCKKFGVANHLENTKAKKKVNFREYLYGKAFFIKMVEPNVGQRFLDELNEIHWE